MKLEEKALTQPTDPSKCWPPQTRVLWAFDPVQISQARSAALDDRGFEQMWNTLGLPRPHIVQMPCSHASMISLIFPKKKYPEDSSELAGYFAKLVFSAGLGALLWSGFYMLQWAKSAGYSQTLGELRYGAIEYVITGVSNASFDYRVGDHTFTSQNIAFGGRPMGGIPPEGYCPVYYDPEEPGMAVLLRRPTEPVIVAMIFGIVSPILARIIWIKYV